MLSTLLFGLGIAIALFFVSNIVFDRYIEKKYLSEEEREQRIEAYKNDLQKYVTDNGLSCDDTKKIAEWARSNKYLYLLIYKDDQLLFESGQYEEEDDPEMGENKENADDGTDNSVENDDDNTEQPGPEDESGNGSDDAGGAEGGNGSEENADNPADNESSDTSGNKYPSSGITVKTPSRDELIAEAVGRGSHPIVATDGVLLASMVDYTEYLYYDVFNIVSLFIAFASFILVMWVYFFEITKRITRLGKEVTAVADGDMHRTITAEGEDEITRLCSDVEYMRSSMLENIEKEHAALEANRELITAMSHDIRTPLTVLLGYIDIMKLNAPEGDMQQYIEASERTALRLKKM
jgi:methyl-accepting chemotaxis protein